MASEGMPFLRAEAARLFDRDPEKIALSRAIV